MVDEDERASIRFREGWLDAGYTQVPNVVLRRHDLSPGAKVVYALLLSYAWQEDHCWPGQERLADEAGASARSVRTWLQELRERGLVTVERRGLTLTNVYWIEALAAAPDRQNMPVNAATDAAPDRQTLPTKKTPVKNTQNKKGSTPDRFEQSRFARLYADDDG
jgi:DNA-binding transcriptional MocR family regulator